MMFAHVLAGCFPNCTPDPSSGFTSGSVGNVPLGLAGIGIIVLFFMRKKGKR